MARTNYSYEKRQREIAKKKKQEEKRQRKLEKNSNATDDAGIAQAEEPTPETGPARGSD
ncbi:MAG: hypothetical protein PVI15_08480 [Chromatiales bacterium]